MTACIYFVYARSHNLHSGDETPLIGVYTTRTLALEAGRATVEHPEDKYFITEEGWLNTSQPRSGIWDSDCDKPDREEYRALYARHWRAGFPTLPVKEQP